MSREYTPTSVEVLVAVLLVASTAAGLVLNLLVLRLRRQRLTLMWAACNLVAVVKTPLLVATMHKGFWPAGELLCRFYMAASTLQQWAAPWLLVICCLQLCLQSRRVQLVGAVVCTAMIGLPVFLIFCTSAHVETEDYSKCFIPVAPDDLLWTEMINFLLSFHTPTIMAACFLLATFVHLPKERNDLKNVGAILASQVLFFLLYWATQLQLLEQNPLTNIDIYLIAGLLMDLHSAVALPSIFLWCGGIRFAADKSAHLHCDVEKANPSLDGFLESLKTELKVESQAENENV